MHRYRRDTIMNLENIKRILIAAIAIGIACVLVWALFKLTVFLVTAAAILLVAGIIYTVIALKLKTRRKDYSAT